MLSSVSNTWLACALEYSIGVTDYGISSRSLFFQRSCLLLCCCLLPFIDPCMFDCFHLLYFVFSDVFRSSMWECLKDSVPQGDST